MRGSAQIAVIKGIPIKIHFSLYVAFLLFVLQFGVFGIFAGLLLFASVLAHELGHALVGRRLGIRIASIELHLLGGAAMMVDHPEDPRDEVIIAAAGPAVSFLLGLAALAAAWLSGGALSVAPNLSNVLSYVAMINLAMGAFNLIPALPMDGGRILRALLVRRFGALRATQIAARVARAFAVLFGLGAVMWGSWSLIFISGFVWMLANHEERVAVARDAAERMERDRAQAFWAAHNGWARDRNF